LLEYQRYQPFDGKKPRNQRWGKPRYLALVLKPAGSITAIDLGPAAVIEERIQQALRATQEQLSDANQLWGQVGKQVLDPLGPALAGVQTLFVSPDGELNRIPFAALPAPGGNALLGDALQLRLLTTGRELLDLAQPRSQAKTAALVVANPAFDQLASNASVLAVRPVDPVESPLGIGGQQRSADLGSLRWSALPGTVKEGQAIAALTGATLLSGSQASATAIEKQAAPRILHIASHGYFLANQPTSPLDKRSLSNSGLPPMGSLPAANLQGESPLLRSGIVLAGANQNSTATGISPGDRGDDGYLTALEITQLDWKGTELVVISACESGKGDIQAGEGVYGLKRAIAVAGARSSLLSLWKVDDAATAAFMQSFYEKLKTGQGRADALAATQKEFRNHSDPGWRNPYVWAAFQLSGDWGPIPGI
jgi:CHAT domain-containing protein